jgi:hypothetical protein
MQRLGHGLHFEKKKIVRNPLNKKKESKYNSREDAKLLAEILPRPIYNRENNNEQPNFGVLAPGFK